MNGSFLSTRNVLAANATLARRIAEELWAGEGLTAEVFAVNDLGADWYEIRAECR